MADGVIFSSAAAHVRGDSRLPCAYDAGMAFVLLNLELDQLVSGHCLLEKKVMSGVLGETSLGLTCKQPLSSIPAPLANNPHEFHRGLESRIQKQKTRWAGQTSFSIPTSTREHQNTPKERTASRQGIS